VGGECGVVVLVICWVVRWLVVVCVRACVSSRFMVGVGRTDVQPRLWMLYERCFLVGCMEWNTTGRDWGAMSGQYSFCLVVWCILSLYESIRLANAPFAINCRRSRVGPSFAVCWLQVPCYRYCWGVVGVVVCLVVCVSVGEYKLGGWCRWRFPVSSV
jgi:hypothetical protein